MTTELAIDLAASRQRWEIYRELRRRMRARIDRELAEDLQQGGAAVAHQIHTLEVAGSNPAPATNHDIHRAADDELPHLESAGGLCQKASAPATSILSEVSGPTEPGAQLATQKSASRNNASDALAAAGQGLKTPLPPSPGATLSHAIDSSTQRSAAVETKRPAAALNPNATAEVYNQVHVHPKGRWS